MATTRAKNMMELRNEVLDTLAQVKDDPRRAVQAHEIGNLAGKAIKSCCVYLDRCKLNRVKSEGEWDKFITGE
jgi:hypothetical protein